MTLTEQTAKHLRDVHFGENWTACNLKQQLADVTWQQATTQVGSFHTIATLVFHMNYFVSAVLQVFEGGTLDAKDKLSFDHDPITSEDAWNALLEKTWQDVEQLAGLVEKLPDSALQEDFWEDKYGNKFRNLHGLIEHCHYHLGQIAMLKRLVAAQDDSANLPS